HLVAQVGDPDRGAGGRACRLHDPAAGLAADDPAGGEVGPRRGDAGVRRWHRRGSRDQAAGLTWTRCGWWAPPSSAARWGSWPDACTARPTPARRPAT